jgi:hypothetical protein
MSFYRRAKVKINMSAGTSKALRFHGFGARGAYELVIYHCRTFAILDKKQKAYRFVQTSLLADGYTAALM